MEKRYGSSHRSSPDGGRDTGSRKLQTRNAYTGRPESAATQEPGTALVVHSRPGMGDGLARDLRRLGYRTSAAWPAPAELPLGVDFVLIEIDPKAMSGVAWLSGVPPVPIIVLADIEKGVPLDALKLTSAHAVLMTPSSPIALLTNLAHARNIFKYEQRLLSKISKLEESLRASREVEQAKLILMRQRKIRGDEAYEYMRQQAMSRQVTVAAIANALIEAYELME